MTDRNYSAEMVELIDRAIPEKGGFTSNEIAGKLISTLEEKDPELLDGWLRMNAESFLTSYVSDILGQRRRYAARQHKSSSRSVFSNAVGAFENGNKEDLNRWLDQYFVVDEEYTRKRLAELTKEDLLFVERAYEARIQENSLEKAFVTALAKKIPAGKTVGDVFSEEKIESLRKSIAA